MPKVYFSHQRRTVSCKTGETIKEVANRNRIKIYYGMTRFLNCMGTGICKSCRVRVTPEENVSPKSKIEAWRLQPDSWRQSCRVRIQGDITVWTQGDFPITQSMEEETGQDSEDDQIEIVEVKPEYVKEILEAGQNIYLLDVRERIEFEKAHIEGANLIPLSELQNRLEEVDKAEDIIIFCHHGMRSHGATEYLLSEGFHRVRNMSGGIDEWSLKVDITVPRY